MCTLRHIILLLALISCLDTIVLAAETQNPPGPSELDQLSSECLSCHDDINEPKNEFHGGHITGIPYEDYTDSKQNFRTKPELPVEMVLLEGKITCATCHGLDPHDGKILVMNNRESALCNSCHMR